jgi:hypothetical protein
MAQVRLLPGEVERVKITRSNYFTMLLPFSLLVALKLYVQNKVRESLRGKLVVEVFSAETFLRDTEK